MNLYQITYDSRVLIVGFFSPLFYEAEDDLEAIGKFLEDCKKQSSGSFSPFNITAKSITPINAIRK